MLILPTDNKDKMYCGNKSFRQKRDVYKRLVGFSPEVIVLMSGGMIKETQKDGAVKYRSTKINEGDAFGILWGEARALAVAELAAYFPSSAIIVTSSPAGNVAMAQSIREELGRFFVSRDRIILEESSTNTLSQIGEAVKIVYKMRIRRVVFVTSKYHVPRANAIYKNFEFLAVANEEARRTILKAKCSGVRVKFVAAETILPYRDQKFVDIIALMEKSSAYRKRILNEKRGLSMIKSGGYGKIETTSTNKLERVI